MAKSKTEDYQGLTQKLAEQRFKQIEDVRYHLSLALDAEKPDYSAKVTLQFKLKAPNLPLSIDFDGGKILNLTSSGKLIANYSYNGKIISLPKGSLKKGLNSIEIDFTHSYSLSGTGLYRFRDPEDGKVYLYSDFEPFDANSFFPCFDQPDLKARYTVQVEAPESWQVVSNTLEESTKSLGNGKKLWTFPETLPFSTYIFALHAGEYKVWESDANGIPLRLMARESFAKWVDAKEFFKITQQGMEFFQKYFDTPYPFGKYDQLIVPDFNSGAMENVGAVTFSERYFPRGESTTSDREDRAEVILHEMAHMWFGNLVTMKWWDDLWLNESFATYISYYAMVHATEFKNAWQTFFLETKQWAYWEDRLVTTHPIVAPVDNTDQAMTRLDGITYGKGASSMKQLSHLVGEKGFQKGLQIYFKKFPYRNAKMQDLMDCFTEGSGVNLKAWTREWLRTANHNNLEVQYQCQANKITKFSVVQSAPKKYPTLRHHRTKIGFYEMKNDAISLSQSVDFPYSKAKTSVMEFVGKDCPTLIYPNHEDYDFVSVSLDPNTLKHVETSLSQIEDPFVRSLFWQSLWDMVLEKRLPVRRYADIVFAHLGKETDVKSATATSNALYGSLHYYPNKTSKHVENRSAFIEKAHEFHWQQFLKSNPGSDLQKLYFDESLRFCRSEACQKKFLEVLKNKIKVKGFVLDQDRRWDILIKLNFLNNPEAESLRQSELKADPSESGEKASLAAQVIKPDLKTKETWMNEVLAKEPKISLGRAEQVMSYIFPREQEKITQKLANKFFEKVPPILPLQTDNFLIKLGRYMTPKTCDEVSIKRLKNFIQKHRAITPTFLKPVRVALQEEERCIALRKYNEASR